MDHTFIIVYTLGTVLIIGLVAMLLAGVKQLKESRAEARRLHERARQVRPLTKAETAALRSTVVKRQKRQARQRKGNQ